MKVLIIRSSQKMVIVKNKVNFPSFLSWPPIIAHTLSYLVVRCKVDPPPSGAPWATFYTAK